MIETKAIDPSGIAIDCLIAAKRSSPCFRMGQRKPSIDISIPTAIPSRLS